MAGKHRKDNPPAKRLDVTKEVKKELGDAVKRAREIKKNETKKEGK